MMLLTRIYSRPVREIFKARITSGAAIFQFISLLVTLIAPLLITYIAQGLWIKTNTYREQPMVNFKYKFLFVLRTENYDKYFVWSSFPGLNQLESDHLRIPTIESTEMDKNRDGKADQIGLKVNFALNPQEAIHSVVWMLIFDYRLELHSRFKMEALLYGETENRLLSGSRLKITGELKFRQRIPIFDRGIDTRYDTPIINASKINAIDFSIENILEKNMERNFGIYLAPYVQIWNPSAINKYFELDFTINYVEDTILYYVGLWELLKWAWVQYLSILLVFIFIVSRVREFVFDNRIVNVVQES